MIGLGAGAAAVLGFLLVERLRVDDGLAAVGAFTFSASFELFLGGSGG